MQITEIKIVAVEFDGRKLEFPSRESAEQVLGILKALNKVIPDTDKLVAAKLLKKHFEAETPSSVPTTEKKRGRKKAESTASSGSEATPKEDKVEQKAEEPVAPVKLPNPPGFARPVDPATGKAPRGRASTAEKIMFANQHADSEEIQAWAKDNGIVLSKVAKKESVKASEPSTPLMPPPAAPVTPPPAAPVTPPPAAPVTPPPAAPIPPVADKA